MLIREFIQADLSWKGVELHNLEKFAILCDESTDSAILRKEIVYIICYKNGAISLRAADADCPFSQFLI